MRVKHLNINNKAMYYYSQDNYRINKEIEKGVIHIPSNHRELEYEYVGLEEVENFHSESSEFRGLEIEDMGVELNRVMGSLLTPMERHVIEMSFGLLSYEEMTTNEIGTELMFTNSHINATKNRALKKLQNYFV